MCTQTHEHTGHTHGDVHIDIDTHCTHRDTQTHRHTCAYTDTQKHMCMHTGTHIDTHHIDTHMHTHRPSGGAYLVEGSESAAMPVNSISMASVQHHPPGHTVAPSLILGGGHGSSSSPSPAQKDHHPRDPCPPPSMDPKSNPSLTFSSPGPVPLSLGDALGLAGRGLGSSREHGERGGTSPTWARPPPSEGGISWQVTRWESRAEWGGRGPRCEGPTRQTRAETQPLLGIGPCSPGDGAGAGAQAVGAVTAVGPGTPGGGAWRVLQGPPRRAGGLCWAK